MNVVTVDEHESP